MDPRIRIKTSPTMVSSHHKQLLKTCKKNYLVKHVKMLDSLSLVLDSLQYIQQGKIHLSSIRNKTRVHPSPTLLISRAAILFSRHAESFQSLWIKSRQRATLSSHLRYLCHQVSSVKFPPWRKAYANSTYAALTCVWSPVLYDGTAATPGHGLDPQVWFHPV